MVRLEQVLVCVLVAFLVLDDQRFGVEGLSGAHVGHAGHGGRGGAHLSHGWGHRGGLRFRGGGRFRHYGFGYRKQARRGYTWGPPGPRNKGGQRRPGGLSAYGSVLGGGVDYDDFFLWNYGLYG